MHNNYAAVNKPKRDDAKAKELADLRRENHELRRTVKRLTKEISKRTAHEEESVDEEAGVVEPPVVTVQAICGCGVEAISLTLNGKLFMICPECKTRKRAE